MSVVAIEKNFFCYNPAVVDVVAIGKDYFSWLRCSECSSTEMKIYVFCHDHNEVSVVAIGKRFFPKGHIFVDSPSIQRRNPRGKFVEITSILKDESTWKLWHRFDVDSTFKIDEISTSSPSGCFYVVSTSNRHNFCTRCFHSIIS